MRMEQAKAFPAGAGDLAEINRFTRRDFTAGELYTFSVVLCDNEIDRDFERFTPGALEELARLFVGKTGIFDHNPSGKNQAARIFRAEAVTDESRVTAAGEPYCMVRARAYMVRGEKNADLIAEIDGGIKKEVSVGCSVGSVRCSVCGADVRAGGGCDHQKGVRYGGMLCHHVLDAPTDAYEWSFVAVPAQVGAGVTKAASFIDRKEEKGMRDFEGICKSFGEAGGEVVLTKEEARAFGARLGVLRAEAALGAEYREDLRREVRRLAFLAGEPLEAEILESVVAKMDLRELKAFHKAYEARVDAAEFPAQLAAGNPAGGRGDIGSFKI